MKIVQAFGQTSASSSVQPEEFMGANFAISERLSRDVNLVVSGQVGSGERPPVPAVDPQVIRNLESQIAGLSSFLSKPDTAGPIIESISPRAPGSIK